MALIRLAGSNFANESASLISALHAAFNSGAAVHYKGRLLKSSLELLTVEDFNAVYVEGSIEPKSSRIAAVEQKALLFPFFEDQTQVDCPHCKTAMKPVKLDGVNGVFCPSCRHTDFDPKMKNVIKAGEPSTERVIDLECKGDGNCSLKA